MNRNAPTGSFAGHRLALGTVQFGMRYGIANERGQVPAEEVEAILREASAAGVAVLDTAIAYGEAEAVLGRAIAATGGSFSVITKLPKGTTAAQAVEGIEGARARLGVSQLHAVLLHDAQDATTQPGLVEALLGLRRQGVVTKLGASLYQPVELEGLRASGLPLELVQLPFSAVDQRFAPHLPGLAAAGVEVHVRSVFLQGLLLLPPDRVSLRFPGLASRVAELRALAVARAVSVPALLLGAAALRPEIRHVVIGVDSLANLRDNVAALAQAASVTDLPRVLAPFAFDDEDVLLPSRWRS